MILPHQAVSPLPVLRTVLKHAARNKKNLPFLKQHYDRAIKRFKKRNFLIYPPFGHQIRNQSGNVIFTCVWIDPFNYDVLVVDHKNKCTRFINAYGLLL